MTVLWGYYGGSVGFLWDFHCMSMIFPWGCYGFSMGFPWWFFGISLGFHKSGAALLEEGAVNDISDESMMSQSHLLLTRPPGHSR